ncbi:hypothetical protein D9M71_88250 [compost metagenome]
MEARCAGFHLAFVLIGLADLELVSAALEVFIEAFESDDGFFSLGLFLASHSSFL